MIRARAGGLLLFGLSDENLRRLKLKQPISFSLAEFGLPNLRVLIFWGATEDEMKAEIEEAAVINELRDRRP
jgi:hypothetical protein